MYAFSVAPIYNLSVSSEIPTSRDDFLERHGARLCRPRPAAARPHSKARGCFERPRFAEAAAAGPDNTVALLWAQTFTADLAFE